MLKRFLAAITGNGPAQKALRYLAFAAQYFMGIGAGATASASGEAAVFRALARRKAPPYCVFDVGANKGQYLGVALASNIGEIKVHAFEPAAETFRQLSANIGDDPRVVLNNCGLGREAGTFELYYNEAGSGLASLTDRRMQHFGVEFSRSEKITLDTVDGYCERHGIDHIDLLKIDVEGHELDVLAGAAGMLDSGRVDMVTFEFGGCNIDTRTFFQDFYYLFSGYGMSLFRISPSGYLCPIEQYSEMLEQFRTTNFLAMRKQ